MLPGEGRLWGRGITYCRRKLSKRSSNPGAVRGCAGMPKGWALRSDTSQFESRLHHLVAGQKPYSIHLSDHRPPFCAPRGCLCQLCGCPLLPIHHHLFRRPLVGPEPWMRETEVNKAGILPPRSSKSGGKAELCKGRFG